MLKKIILTIVAIFVITGAILLLRLPDFDFIERDLFFTYSGKVLAGRMAIPRNINDPYPVAIFIHGDGPINRTGNDDYLYHWQRLTEAGIACFSWDKQGVGQSEGNWEHQDMEDRAREVIAAIEFLKTKPEVLEDKIGLIGFSQAGWVMPYVSTLSDYPDFIVSVSGAINVVSQGDYLNKKRLLKKGFSLEEIEEYKLLEHKLYEMISNGLSYNQYIDYWIEYLASYEGEGAEPMTYDRFIFSKNKWPDARNHLKNIKCPILAVFGKQDLNVDIIESMDVYNNELKKIDHPDYQIELFNNGTHALTKADLFQDKTISIMDIAWHGESIYADGYLDLITNWVKSRSLK